MLNTTYNIFRAEVAVSDAMADMEADLPEELVTCPKCGVDASTNSATRPQAYCSNCEDFVTI